MMQMSEAIAIDIRSWAHAKIGPGKTKKGLPDERSVSIGNGTIVMLQT